MILSKCCIIAGPTLSSGYWCNTLWGCTQQHLLCGQCQYSGIMLSQWKSYRRRRSCCTLQNSNLSMRRPRCVFRAFNMWIWDWIDLSNCIAHIFPLQIFNIHQCKIIRSSFKCNLSAVVFLRCSERGRHGTWFVLSGYSSVPLCPEACELSTAGRDHSA